MHQLIITRRPKWLWLMIIKIKKGKKRRRLWLMIRKFFFKKIMIRKLRRIKFWRGGVNINSFPLYFLKNRYLFHKKKKRIIVITLRKITRSNMSVIGPLQIAKKKPCGVEQGEGGCYENTYFLYHILCSILYSTNHNLLYVYFFSF